MGTVSIEKLLWCRDGNHDKIWGWVKTPYGDLYRFWGKRSVKDDGWTDNKKRPSLRFKQDTSVAALERLGYQKIDKGYQGVSVDNVDNVIPGFNEYFEQALMLAKLSDNV